MAWLGDGRRCHGPFLLDRRLLRLAVGLRMIENAGDSRQRVDQSGRFELTIQPPDEFRRRNGVPLPRRFSSSLPNKAEFCHGVFAARYAHTGGNLFFQGRACSSWPASRNSVASSPNLRGKHHAERQSGLIPCQRHRHRGLAGHVEHGGRRHVAAQDRRDMRQILRHRVELADAQRRRTQRRAQEDVARLEERREAARNLEGGELGGDIVGRRGLLRVVALASVNISKSFSVIARPNLCSISRTVSAVLPPTIVAMTAAGSAASTGARSSTWWPRPASRLATSRTAAAISGSMASP